MQVRPGRTGWNCRSILRAGIYWKNPGRMEIYELYAEYSGSSVRPGRMIGIVPGADPRKKHCHKGKKEI